MLVQSWLNVVTVSLQNLWQLVISFIPSLLGAIVVLIIGLIVAAGLERLVERLAFYLKLDAMLKRLGVESYLDRTGMKLNAGVFLGKIVYWFILVAFFVAASDILGFAALSSFLNDVLRYIPNVLVAALILLATVVVANFVKGVVAASVMGARLHAAKFLGVVAWWVVMVFGFLTAAVQLNIAVSIINAVVTGIIAMFALAGGLSLGLGGRDAAMRWVNRMEDEVMHKG